MKMNKKGDVIQILYLLIILFLGAVFFLLCYGMSSRINTAVSEITPNDTIAYEVNEVITENTPTIFDTFIFFLFLGGIIGLMVAAVRTDFSAGIIFIFILIAFMTVLVASGLVNIYRGFTDAPGLAEISGRLTLTNIVFSRYTPLIICVLAGIILLLMYGKSGGDIPI